MKICKIFLSFFLLLLFSAGTAYSEEREYIEVYGYGSTTAKADKAQIEYSVEGLGKTLAIAFSEARQKVDNISQQLIHLGLKEDEFQTSSFYSGENYSKSFFSSKRDYRARLSVFVTITDLRLIEPAILKISENDVQSISQANFSVKDESGFYDKARSKAILDAQKKARDMAKNFGVKLGKSLYAIEIPMKQDTIEIYGRALRMSEGGELDSSVSKKGIFPEKIEFEAKIKAGFEILPTKPN